jgi:hypothetical protein
MPAARHYACLWPFSAKIENTKAEAIRAAKHYGLLPELF